MRSICMRSLRLGQVLNFSAKQVQQVSGSRVFSSVNIPSNLKLADESVFLEEPKPKVENDLLYYFPPLVAPSTLPVVCFQNPDNKLDETVALDPVVFRVALRKDIVHNVIVYHRAKLRQPKKTKRKSEIRGSNKKPYAQKGSGRAQVGHRRNSVWRGGQKAHGPVLRDYSIGCNRKTRALATMILLASKEKEGNLIVVDKFDLGDHRTSSLSKILDKLNLSSSRCILIDDYFTRNFNLASRNIPNVQTSSQLETHVYDMIRADKLVFTKSALASIQARLVSQYQHQGKRGAYKKALNEYRAMAEEGKANPFDIKNVGMFVDSLGYKFDADKKKYIKA